MQWYVPCIICWLCCWHFCQVIPILQHFFVVHFCGHWYCLEHFSSTSSRCASCDRSRRSSWWLLGFIVHFPDMGYTLSRFEDAANMDDEVVDAPCTTQKLSEESSAFTDEFYHQTKLRSAPNEMMRKLSRIESGRRIPTVKMLSTREFNLSGKGRFYSQDRCHLLSRFLPVNGPWRVDSLNSRAYVSQYSADGTLFVGGFQVSPCSLQKHSLLCVNKKIVEFLTPFSSISFFQASQIRIYDVDERWKVRKDILAKSLRWTVTDTSLSPDQRYLVCYTPPFYKYLQNCK